MTTFVEYHGRAKADFVESAQNLRSCVQLSIVSNGGAALAMLSSVTELVTATETSQYLSTQVVISWFATSAGFFLAGVLFALISLGCFALSRERWGYFWEEIAEKNEAENGGASAKPNLGQHPYARSGTRYYQFGIAFLVLGVTAFLPGAVSAIAPFLHFGA